MAYSIWLFCECTQLDSVAFSNLPIICLLLLSVHDPFQKPPSIYLNVCLCQTCPYISDTIPQRLLINHYLANKEKNDIPTRMKLQSWNFLIGSMKWSNTRGSSTIEVQLIYSCGCVSMRVMSIEQYNHQKYSGVCSILHQILRHYKVS